MAYRCREREQAVPACDYDTGAVGVLKIPTPILENNTCTKGKRVLLKFRFQMSYRVIDSNLCLWLKQCLWKLARSEGKTIKIQSRVAQRSVLATTCPSITASWMPIEPSLGAKPRALDSLSRLDAARPELDRNVPLAIRLCPPVAIQPQGCCLKRSSSARLRAMARRSPHIHRHGTFKKLCDARILN